MIGVRHLHFKLELVSFSIRLRWQKKSKSFMAAKLVYIMDTSHSMFKLIQISSYFFKL